MCRETSDATRVGRRNLFRLLPALPWPLVRWAGGAACVIGLAALPVAAAPAIDRQPPAAQCARSQVTIRLFLDLQCQHCRKAWPLYVQVAGETPCATLVVHHLPVSTHAHAAWAAQTAVAARSTGKELAFIDALYAYNGSDRTHVERALVAAGADVGATTAMAASSKSAVDSEKQSALAFGVRATPSALINGSGLAGVPTADGLRRAVARALNGSASLLAQAAAVDVERTQVLLQTPEYLPAFESMRNARALTAASEGPVRGALGGRYRVTLRDREFVVGKANAAITVVAFVDPTLAWTVQDASALLSIQAVHSDMRVALVWRPTGSSALVSVQLASMLAAAAVVAPSAVPAILGAWTKGNAPTTAELGTHIARVHSQQAAAIATRSVSGDIAAVVNAAFELSRRVDANAGAVFVNGRRWFGRVSDAGFSATFAGAAAEFRDQVATGTAATGTYAALIANGSWRSDADLDLGPASELNGVASLPSVGVRGPQVVLLVDFSSSASRAAWFMLRRLVVPGGSAIRLHVASLSRGKAPLAHDAAFLAAAFAGKAEAAAETLFAATKPSDHAMLTKVAAQAGLDRAGWDQALRDPRIGAAQRAVKQLDRDNILGDEPVIIIDGRVYCGPLDESRLLRALFAPVRSGSAADADQFAAGVRP
ncbi:MAG: hypothetical protein EXR77_00080 [Myxococcales bacterium]|nr:hypothetical protein [Myxococcales bacterium]